MPELPDVEHWRRYVSRHAAGRPVERVEAPEPAVLRNTSAQGLGQALAAGSRLPEPQRHGKWLMLPGNSSRVLIHFGMTGSMAWTSRPGGLDSRDHVVFHLHGGRLTYRSVRKLGGIWLAPTDQAVREITGPLGPDALELARKQFRERIADRRGSIKTALMDQERIAGIGNELSDEILFQARLDPRHRVGDLDTSDFDDLYDKLREVLTTSVEHGRIPRQPGWITSVRGDETAPCPRCGGRVRTEVIGGRTSYWCPSCQDGGSGHG